MMIIIAVIAAALLSSGCFSPVDVDFIDAETVAVRLVFTSAGRTIQPETDLQPVEYQLTAIGPNGSSRERTLSDTAVSLELEPGSWIFSVNAYAAEGLHIGQASLQADVAADSGSTILLVLQPVEGSGQLLIDITWESGAVSQPDIAAALTPAGTDIAQAIQFAVQDGSAGYQSDTIDAGYYLFEAVLYDDTVKLTSTGTQIVRIVAGETTAAQFSWSLASSTTGVQVNLDTSSLEPIPLTITAGSSEMTQDAPLELTTEIPTADLTAAEIEAVELWWYVDGTVVQHGTTSCILPDSLAPGTYAVSVILIAGTRAASDTLEITVLPAPDPPASGAAIVSALFDPSVITCGTAVTAALGAEITEYGDTLVSEVTAVIPEHPAVSLAPSANNSWSGSADMQFALAGTYACEMAALDGAGIILDTRKSPLRVRADPLVTRTAFYGSDFDGDAGDLGLPGGAEVSAAEPLVGSGCLHFAGEFSDSAGTTITIPLTTQPFVQLQDSSVLSFWFRGTVAGKEPALRIQVAGGGSVRNYYDLNGIQGDESRYALAAGYGGVFPNQAIDVPGWTRVELDVTDVDWAANGGSSAEDYVFTIRIRSGSVHDWYLDDIRFE